MTSLDDRDHEYAGRFSFSSRVVLLAFVIIAAALAAVANVSLYTVMWARTLASAALILATVGSIVATSRTRAFCRGYALAGWSYILLAHSDIAGESLSFERPYKELLHVHIAQTARYAFSGDASRATEDMFAATFSFVSAILLSCLAGALAAQYCGGTSCDRPTT
jgi:hypothetical protein